MAHIIDGQDSREGNSIARGCSKANTEYSNAVHTSEAHKIYEQVRRHHTQRITISQPLTDKLDFSYLKKDVGKLEDSALRQANYGSERGWEGS
jgi:hypothetical protein